MISTLPVGKVRVISARSRGGAAQGCDVDQLKRKEATALTPWRGTRFGV